METKSQFETKQFDCGKYRFRYDNGGTKVTLFILCRDRFDNVYYHQTDNDLEYHMAIKELCNNLMILSMV